MSDSQTDLARLLGVSTRTALRWRRLLSKSKSMKFSEFVALPRIQKQHIERIGAALGGVESLRIHDEGIRIREVFMGGSNSTPAWLNSDKFRRVVDVTLKVHELRRDDTESEESMEALRIRDPDRYQLLWDVSLAQLIDPRAVKVKSDPLVDLRIAARELGADGVAVTGGRLATKLRISRATLYRKFTAEEISEAIPQKPHHAPPAPRAKPRR